MAPIDELFDILQRETRRGKIDDRLRETISQLDNVRRPEYASLTSARSTEEQFAVLLRQLLDEGKLEESEKVKEIIEKLEEEHPFLWSAFAHSSPKSRNTPSHDTHRPGGLEEPQSTVSIVIPPQPSKPLPLPLLPWNIDNGRMNDLNDIYFLHTLANSPETLIPPGKSLRSVLSGSQAAEALGDTSKSSGSTLPTLQQKVEEIAKKAFWDEAKESLSDPTPGKQLARLKTLHSDLHEKLDGLISPKHPVMISLSAPLSPSSNPLLSTSRHLEVVTNTLKTLCAPVRDEALESVIELLNDEDKRREERVAESFKQLFHVADLMKQDMSSVLLNSVSDEDLHLELIRQARSREVRAILDLWSLESVRSSWDAWSLEPSGFREGDVRWVRSLVNALGGESAVHCLPPEINGNASSSTSSSSKDTIPAPFLFCCPSLHRIQNHLQAITIAATLRTLVPLPRQDATASNSTTPTGSSFAARILSLLMIEVNEEEDSGTIKLTNLADEVVREYQRLADSSLSRSSSFMDDASLRAATDKLLRPTDPVYSLLRKRLLEAIVSQVSSALRRDRAQQAGPNSMHTGREAKRLKPDPTLKLDLRHDKRDMSLGQLKVDAFHVKGFEEEILAKNILDATNGICKVVEWIRNGWGDLLSLE